MKKVNNFLVGITCGLVLVSPLHANTQDSILKRNLEQLSSYTQECRDYVRLNPSINPEFVQEKLRGIEAYLQTPTSENLDSIQGIEFTQIFEGMRGTSCSMLPAIMYDIEDGIFVNYRS